MKFFFDNCMPLRVVHGLAALGLFYEDVIVHLKDDKRFRPESLDTEIYNTLSQEIPLPVVVSCDLAQKTRGSPEREALRASGLTVVFFAKNYANLSIHPQALITIKAWPDIRAAVKQCAVATLFEVSARGKVISVFPTAQLKV